MTTRKVSDAASVPTASPEPECNTGYAEPKPRDKAQARAQTYADALGLKVRRIVSISEGGASFPRPMPMMRAMAADAGFAKETSVSPGETTLSVNIDVVFELGR